MKGIIKLEKDFLPEHTFDCGQCFRWNREEDGSYTGVAFGKAVNLSYDGKEITLNGATDADVKAIWEDYFDIGRDYSAVKKSISVSPVVKEAVAFGEGIRILKQEFFETLLSFIISQQSSIPKIKSTVEKLASLYGDEIELSGKVYYAFPTPEALRDVTEEDFARLGTGYRAKYLRRAVLGVLEGEISKEKMDRLTTGDARAELLKIYGVGNKVADCILLFSLARFDSFPVDVWINRVIKEDLGGKSGQELFGPYSGFAQQYLFYWKRSKH